MRPPERFRPRLPSKWNAVSRPLITLSSIIGTLLIVCSLPTAAAAQPAGPLSDPSAASRPIPLRLFFHACGPQLSGRQETAPVSPSLNEREQAEDRWIAYDKLQHLTFSFLSTLSSQYVLTTKLHWHHSYGPLIVSSGAAGMLGVGKELYDRRREGVFSIRDLAADGVGILLASGLVLL